MRWTYLLNVRRTSLYNNWVDVYIGLYKTRYESAQLHWDDRYQVILGDPMPFGQYDEDWVQDRSHGRLLGKNDMYKMYRMARIYARKKRDAFLLQVMGNQLTTFFQRRFGHWLGAFISEEMTQYMPTPDTLLPSLFKTQPDMQIPILPNGKLDWGGIYIK